MEYTKFYKEVVNIADQIQAGTYESRNRVEEVRKSFMDRKKPEEEQKTEDSFGILAARYMSAIRNDADVDLEIQSQIKQQEVDINVTPVKNKGVYVDMARAAAQKNGIPEELFLRLVKQESGFKPTVTSSAGAYGLAQLMPGTAKYLGVDSSDPSQNVDGGARYLKEQYEEFGRWDLALAAYNAGPGAVKKYGGIPPYKETRNYVKAILGN